jgi:hypothetical protein
MSNEENAKKAVDTAKEIAGKLFTTMMDLKEKNAKVFYGVVGGVVLLLLIIMMSGGGSETVAVTGPSAKNLAAGQRYVLKNPNTFEIASPIKLLPVPGSIAAYDDTEDEEKGKVESCRRIPQGTAITIIGLQDFAGKKNAFANVQVEEGECKGNTGWISSINIQ